MDLTEHGWPSLQGQEIAKIRESFSSPLQLAGAFDTVEEAAELVGALWPGISAQGCDQRAQLLMEWSKEAQREHKRQKRLGFYKILETLPGQAADRSVSEVFEESSKQNPLALLAALERRKKIMPLDQDASQRAEKEKLAREKYAVLLADVIKGASLPLVAQLEAIQDGGVSWKRIFGTRRSKTLRNRYKAWKAFEFWLETVHGKRWPDNVRHLIGYANERLAEGCGKTVLNSFQAALVVLETAGRVKEEDMLSRDKAWLAQLQAITAELEGEQPSVRQAPMLTVAIVVALEVFTAMVSEPAYERAMAFVALLMTYCSLRADDVQGLDPSSLEVTSSGLRARLTHTKTTGPGKRIKEIIIHVHRVAGLSGHDWIKAGLDLWQRWGQPRDYMVLEAKDDWSGPTHRGVDAQGVALYVRRIMMKLGTPKLDGSKFRLNQQRPLMGEGAHSHFTGHSPRNFMPSVAAAIGVSKDDRDFLGRWLINRMKGSADYTRTSREVVMRVQQTVCKAILEGKDVPYAEEDALSDLKKALDAQGHSGSMARRRHDIMKQPDGSRHLGLKWPPFQPEAGSPVVDCEDSASEGGAEETKYFITTSRSGHRRLHLNGPCHVKPFHCSSVSFTNTVSSEDIDSICRDCRQRMRSEAGQDPVAESSSDSVSTE